MNFFIILIFFIIISGSETAGWMNNSADPGYFHMAARSVL